MNISHCSIPGPLVIDPNVFGDDRGFFFESWNASIFKHAGLDCNFVQDNHSRSNRGVLRGLHFQNPTAQGKLVRVCSGSVWDVAVDLRKSSAHFGKWFGIELSAINKKMFWVPPGFAHGFLTLEDGTDFLYKCTDYYAPEHEQSLAWNDPAIGIEWPLNGMTPQLSPKDSAGFALAKLRAFT